MAGDVLYYGMPRPPLPFRLQAKDTKVLDVLVHRGVQPVRVVVRALALTRAPSPQAAIKFFAWSNVYLMLVFVAVAVDAFVR